jgi:hypothetical protein
MSVTNPEGVKKYFVAAFPRYEKLFFFVYLIIRVNLFLVLVEKQI